MISLDKRLTHRYVGTYQHEDRWEHVANADEIGRREIARSESDEEDPCDPKSYEIFLLIKSDKPDEEIAQAIRDSHTQSGCHHEWDCCGCRSYYAGKGERVTGDLWRVVVSSSRNY
jgi:hypothetical protein